jgi:hypothetical protein
MEKEKIIQALTDWYITTNCLDKHECRQYSLFIWQIIEVIEGEQPIPEISNCDCYECKAY